MNVNDERIPDEFFAEFLQRLPQVSVELLVEYEDGALLLRRTNEPAKGEWFVPGGRLYKGETFAAAVDRVAETELSIEVSIHDQLGTYNHYWDSGNLPGVEETHTVNVVHHVHPAGDPSDLALDDQHDEYRLVSEPTEDLHPYIRTYLRDSGIVD